MTYRELWLLSNICNNRRFSSLESIFARCFNVGNVLCLVTIRIKIFFIFHLLLVKLGELHYYVREKFYLSNIYSLGNF